MVSFYLPTINSERPEKLPGFLQGAKLLSSAAVRFSALIEWLFLILSMKKMM